MEPQPEPEMEPEPEMVAVDLVPPPAQPRTKGRLTRVSSAATAAPSMDLVIPPQSPAVQFASLSVEQLARARSSPDHLVHAASAPPEGHGVESPHGHARPRTPIDGAYGRRSAVVKPYMHPAQQVMSEKHSHEEVRLCARLMRERLHLHGPGPGRGVEDVDVGKALVYLTQSGEASNEYRKHTGATPIITRDVSDISRVMTEAARIGQRMIDAEIWYHGSLPKQERKDFTNNMDKLPRDAVFRY